MPSGKLDLAVDVQSRVMRPGEILLICSDGLTTMVPDPKIEAILAEAGGDIERAATDLVAAANAQGGEDNITVVLLKFEE